MNRTVNSKREANFNNRRISLGKAIVEAIGFSVCMAIFFTLAIF